MDIMKLIVACHDFVNVSNSDEFCIEVLMVMTVALCRLEGDWLECACAESRRVGRREL
jgi:hypothetical protein